MNTNKTELKQNELTEVTGGGPITKFANDYYGHGCMHKRKFKTGNQREDPRWIFASQHQFEYQCHDCKKTFWVDEEP